MLNSNVAGNSPDNSLAYGFNIMQNKRFAFTLLGLFGLLNSLFTPAAQAAAPTVTTLAATNPTQTLPGFDVDVLPGAAWTNWTHAAAVAAGWYSIASSADGTRLGNDQTFATSGGITGFINREMGSEITRPNQELGVFSSSKSI